MKKFLWMFIAIFIVCSTSAQDNPIRYDFSNAVNLTVQGAGFGQYAEADVSYGNIPTGNAFVGATDGRGMIVVAKPGEGVMILTKPIHTVCCALLRCSIRLSAPHASLCLASIDQSEKGYISTITPTNNASFVNQYGRIADFFLPPSNGFLGIVQVLNTSETESLTAYLDNLEVLILDEGRIDLAIPEITGTMVETITISLDLPVGAKDLVMVKIPAGTFMMGSPSTEKKRDSDEMQHEVTLTNDFYIGMYEVTQAQWQAVMGNNPSYFKGYDRPVERVSWNDCQEFIQKLNERGYGTFRLPTEAEWEYACRAGTTTAFYWGEDSNYSQIENYAWYSGNSSSQTHEVGLKLPNNFGLFDMSGNVWEWCQDWYGNYSSENQINPTGTADGEGPMARGGGWLIVPEGVRSADRAAGGSDTTYYSTGLRLVMART